MQSITVHGPAARQFTNRHAEVFASVRSLARTILRGNHEQERVEVTRDDGEPLAVFRRARIDDGAFEIGAPS